MTRHAADDHTGVTDEDIRCAYMKLWHSCKDGSLTYPGAMLGPALDILVMVKSVEHVTNGHYQLTETGKTIWAHMATASAGRFDIDQELMRRANWIMTVQGLLEVLEHGDWMALPRNITYAVRKECRDNNFVETQGKTSATEYRLTSAGVDELARLRAEDAPAFVEESRLVEKSRLDAALKSAAEMQIVDEADTEDLEPEGYVEAIIEVDWQQIAADRQTEIDRLTVKLTDYEKELFQSIHTLMTEDGHAWRTALDYVHHLRQRVVALANDEDPDMVAIIEMAIADDQGDLSPADYVQHLREHLAAMDSDHNINGPILDELCQANEDIRILVEARRTYEAKLRAIRKG